MRLLIDGNNLMPHLGINPKSDNSRLRFYQVIPRLLKNGDNAIIFFDGLSQGSTPKIGNARVIFSGKRKADDEIILYAGQGDILVTSDSELGRMASGLGASTIKCPDFIKQRKIKGRCSQEDSEELKRHFSSKSEKQYWESVFQIDKEKESE